MRPLVYRDIVKIGKYVFYMFLCFLITLYNWWPHGRMAASEDVRLVHQLYFRVNMFSYIVTAPFQVSFALLGGKKSEGNRTFIEKMRIFAPWNWLNVRIMEARTISVSVRIPKSYRLDLLQQQLTAYAQQLIDAAKPASKAKSSGGLDQPLYPNTKVPLP